MRIEVIGRNLEVVVLPEGCLPAHGHALIADADAGESEQRLIRVLERHQDGEMIGGGPVVERRKRRRDGIQLVGSKDFAVADVREQQRAGQNVIKAFSQTAGLD